MEPEMKKPVLIVGLTLTLLLIFIVIYLALAQKQVLAPTKNTEISKTIIQSPSPISFVGKEDILKNALNLYIKNKEAGMDMSKGPCLGKIANDWVLDIAHNPRQPEDDKIENQCSEFREGKVHHFIELDPQGNLINKE